MYDAAIIGAGVVGSAIARELSKYNINACVIEKDEDVCSGTSKANSAIVHAGFDATPGTLKAQLNVEGKEITEKTNFKEDLGVDSLDLFELVMAFEEEYGVSIPSEELENLATVGDVIRYIQEHA